MKSLARIARFSLIALVWFTAMLGFAMLFRLALALPYDTLELSPLARTLATMALSITVATAIAVLSWQALRREVPVVPGAVTDRTEGGDASFARIG